MEVLVERVRRIAVNRASLMHSASANKAHALINAFFSAPVIRLIRCLAALDSFKLTPQAFVITRATKFKPIEDNPMELGFG